MSQPSDARPIPSKQEKRTVTLGLVPSPDHCERVAADIAPLLPELLAGCVDDTVTWRIAIKPDPLIGSYLELPDLLDEVDDVLRNEPWNYAICLTDLPIRRHGRIVIADASNRRNIAYISLPPLGVIRLRARTRAMIVELMTGLRRQASKDDAAPRQVGIDVAELSDHVEEKIDSDVRYVAPRLMGHLHLIAGMVYANRPWSLFPSFKATVATAFATGGYGLIFTTLWEIGNIYGVWRLITLMLAAMSILIGWIVISHRLWEPHRGASSQYLTAVYNATTVLTITTGVVFAYVIIFALLLVAAFIYIPASMLESTIGQAVTPINYLKIAWVTSSVATIAGAVGAGLEDTEAVRNATFGWRQSNRWEQSHQAQDG